MPQSRGVQRAERSVSDAADECVEAERCATGRAQHSREREAQPSAASSHRHRHLSIALSDRAAMPAAHSCKCESTCEGGSGQQCSQWRRSSGSGGGQEGRRPADRSAAQRISGLRCGCACARCRCSAAHDEGGRSATCASHIHPDTDESARRPAAQLTRSAEKWLARRRIGPDRSARARQVHRREKLSWDMRETRSR